MTILGFQGSLSLLQAKWITPSISQSRVDAGEGVNRLSLEDLQGEIAQGESVGVEDLNAQFGVVTGLRSTLTPDRSSRRPNETQM